MGPTQTLPPPVSDYVTAQRAEIIDATKAVNRQWRRVGNDFDAGWRLIAPTVLAIMDEAQRRISAGSAEYIPAVLAATGQAVQQLADPEPSALVGLTGAGLPTVDALSVATIRAKQSVADGASAFLALQDAGKYLSYVAGTILSDTGRSAEGLGMAAFGSTGWVRVLSPPSCARCVILAGRIYRHSEGFLRHPGCDCRHMPAGEVMEADLTVDPMAYYESLDEAGRLKFAGSLANVKAIDAGADINQIVNAYRRTSGMRFAQVSPIKLNKLGDKFTTEGTTRRGLATQQQTGLRRNGAVQARLMPESIYMRAKNPDDALRLLKLYGWISDSRGLTQGRATLAEQRRLARNARARERRALAR